MASFKQHRPLSYARCAQFFALARSKAKGYPLAYNQSYYIQRQSFVHPVSGECEEAYALLMHSTHILRYFEDGAIVLRDYNSVTTSACFAEFAPTYVAAMISDSEMPDIEPPGFRNYKFVPSFPHMYAVNKLVKSIVKDHLADTGFSSDPYFETVEAQRYVDVRVSRSR